MQMQERHPYLVQGWNWNWFGGRGREKKRMHTIEYGRSAWTVVEKEIEDAYFTWEDPTGVKHKKEGAEYIQACNTLFEDAAEAWERLQMYHEERDKVQSQSFRGAKKLAMDRIEEHIEKHWRRLMALFWYLHVLKTGWQKNTNRPVDEWDEVLKIRQSYSEGETSWADYEIDKLRENYDRMYRGGEWEAWWEELDYQELYVKY